jgi:hypothetical protein
MKKDPRFRESFKNYDLQRSVTCATLFCELAQHLLPSCDCFTLPLGARLFVMLTLLQLGEDPRLLAFPLEAAKRILERLVFFDVYERHSPIPPLRLELWRADPATPVILGSGWMPVNETGEQSFDCERSQPGEAGFDSSAL